MIWIEMSLKQIWSYSSMSCTTELFHQMFWMMKNLDNLRIAVVENTKDRAAEVDSPKGLGFILPNKTSYFVDIWASPLIRKATYFQ